MRMAVRRRDRANNREAAAALCADVRRGLVAAPPSLPPKYFYDALGAQLFERITRLDEYYLTRTEIGILEANAHDIAARIGARARVIEFGSGSGIKTRLLLRHLHDPVAWVPVDISCRQLHESAATIADEFPHLEVLPECADYTGDLTLPASRRPADATVAFFPGSTIGNFARDEAAAFLGRVARLCGPGGRLLIGADLDKDPDVLERAYNDAAGVTAAFNLNVLARINRECGADFDTAAFRHHAPYDRAERRIEMRLVCTQDTAVTVPDCGGDPLRVAFTAGDFIVTEHSHKYSPDDFERLAARCGWGVEAFWTDARRWFGVWLLRRD